MDNELGTTIARRGYFRAGDESRTPVIDVEVGKPVPSPHMAGEFMCSFRIRSGEPEKIETVFGIDELQALQLALGYLKVKLQRLNEASDLQLRWIGDEDGDLGIRLPEF